MPAIFCEHKLVDDMTTFLFQSLSESGAFINLATLCFPTHPHTIASE